MVPPDKDPALERRFQPVVVPEPSEEEAEKTLVTYLRCTSTA